jgi:hypothetical protein
MLVSVALAVAVRLSPRSVQESTHPTPLVGTNSVDLDLEAPPVAARATAGDKESEVSEVRLPQEAALASPLSPA